MSFTESISFGNDYSHLSEDGGDNDQKHCKGKSSEGKGLNKGKTVDTVVYLHDQFYDIMVNDHDLYLRILRYEVGLSLYTHP